MLAAAVLALTPIIAYVIDRAGLGLQAWPALGAGIALTIVATVLRPGPIHHGAGDLAAWAGIVIFLVAMFLRMSWPSLVPPGRGPDLTHHLLLVDYIQQHGHLVHDRSLDGAMGEMAHYTPASHLLAVVFGAAFGFDGLRAVFPLTVVGVALTAGFAFLIARRGGLPLPYALVAVALLFLPAQYLFGAFTHDGFLAQAVATLFAVGTWWAIVQWHDRPGAAGACVIAVFLVATFLAWPIWLGAPLLVFLAMLLRAELLPRARAQQLAIAIVPLVTVFLAHSWNRWGWMAIVRTSGAVLHPSLDSLGAVLPLLALAGIVVAASDRRARVTIVLLVVIVLQAATLLAIANAYGADTPYMALKMMYLAIYPMAVLGAYALKWGVGILELRVGSGESRVSEPIGWLIAAALLIVSVRPALTAPRSIPVVDLDLNAAGQWLRSNGGAACADYLVADAETAYWLHLAVLGNARSGERMRELDRYDPRAAVGPWIIGEGRSFAVADLRLLPAEVRTRVEVRRQFGNAAVIARPGTQHCAP